AAGRLNAKMYGPPVPVRENEVGQIEIGIENRDGAGRFLAETKLPPGEGHRRSVYVQVRRSKPLGVLDTFDGAAADPNCEARNSSTVAPQALLLLNNDFVTAQAEGFAQRVARAVPGDPGQQVAAAWRVAYGVGPAAAEKEKALMFLKELTAHYEQTKD